MMRFRHHITLLLGVMLSCCCARLAASDALKERYTAEHPLVFEDAWEKWPYSFVNSKGEPDGFDVELTREVMRRLGLPFVVKLCDQDSVYRDMEAKRATLTFATKIGPFLEYGNFGNVTITQAETSLMVPRRDSVKHITISELCKRKIHVREGSISHYALVDAGMPDSLISVEEHMAMAILDMVSNEEGGALWNTVMLKWLMRKYDIKDYVLVPTDIPSAEYRYMSNDAELLHAIDSVCLSMQQQGSIDAMKVRWMNPEKESNGYLYLYILGALVGVVVILTAIVFLIKYYRTYYSHTTLNDVNEQMNLVLSSHDVRVWVYDIQEDSYAWMTPDGRVEEEYSAFEFSRFYDDEDFQTIHSEVKKLKKGGGNVVTKHLQQCDVSMQAITDDYGKAYVVCGVEYSVLRAKLSGEQSSEHSSTPSKHFFSSQFTVHSSCAPVGAQAQSARTEGGAKTIEGVGRGFIPQLKEIKRLAEEILSGEWRESAGKSLKMIIFMVLLSMLPAVSSMAKPLGISYTKKHPLVIVCDWNFAPYSFRNDNMQADGFLVEMVENIFNQIHVPYEIRMVDWKQAKRMLYSGEAQLMIDIRKPDDLYGVKYGKSVLADYPLCVARLRDTPAMGSIEMLDESDTIHVNYGDYALHYIVTVNDKPILMPCEPYNALSDILSGKIKYYVWSKVALQKQLKNFNLQKEIVLDEVDISEGQFRFMSNDSVLLSEIDKQFLRMQTLGHYKPLVDKWLTTDATYEESATSLDIIAIVAMLLLFVGSIIALVFIMRGGSTSNLKKEFRAIAHMAITLTGCNVLAINVKRMWVYNVSGDFIPRKGLSMADYEALIHPDDIMTEYDVRKRVDEGERDMPVVSFRMRKYDDAPDNWHRVSVYAYIKAKGDKLPAYVYLALKVEEITPSQQAPLQISSSVGESDSLHLSSPEGEGQEEAFNPANEMRLRKMLEDLVKEIDKSLK